MITNSTSTSTHENTNRPTFLEEFIPSFTSSKKLQNKVSSELVTYDTANDTTQRTIVHNAIYYRDFVEHCAVVALETMKGYEEDLEPLKNEKSCLREKIDKYTKKHGNLDEATMKRILSNYTMITIDAKDKSNNIGKRLAASNRRVIEQTQLLE